MKDEIKEILDYLKDNDNYIEDIGGEHKRIGLYEAKILLDYITNLQEELQYQKEAELEYNDKHTKLMNMYSDLKQKVNKVIEYLEEPNRDNFDYCKAYMIQILQGKSDE